MRQLCCSPRPISAHDALAWLSGQSRQGCIDVTTSQLPKQLSWQHCMQVSTLLLTPVCPHTCEHIWRDVLGRLGSALTAGFPAGKAPSFALSFAGERDFPCLYCDEITCLMHS